MIDVCQFLRGFTFGTAGRPAAFSWFASLFVLPFLQIKNGSLRASFQTWPTILLPVYVYSERLRVRSAWQRLHMVHMRMGHIIIEADFTEYIAVLPSLKLAFILPPNETLVNRFFCKKKHFGKTIQFRLIIGSLFVILYKTMRVFLTPARLHRLVFPPFL